MNAITLFCLALIILPVGSVRIGGKEAKPDYSYAGWIAMMFAAGIGIGIVGTIHHWGLEGWAIYAAVGLSLAIFCYNLKLPLTLRSAFYPILDE